MAAILQLRQGSTSTYISQGPNIAEPFFDTGSNILVVGKSGTEVIKLTKLDESNVGSFSITGDLTASNAILSGDITIGGNIILGDEATDDITISGQLDSDLIPKTDNTHDLGSTTKKWANLHVVSGSIDSIDLTSNLPSGVVSGSSQLPSGIISGSSQLPSGTVSGSSQITYLDISSKPTGIVSGSSQVAELLPEGTLSGSSQVENILPSGVISGSEQLPSGIISGSSQLPTGVVSGSTQITDGSNIFSSSLQVVAINIPGFQSERTRGNNIDGVLSGSGQLPDGVVSGSSQVIELLPTDTISGSSQISELTHLHSFTSSYNNAISLNGDDVTILGDLVVQGTQTQLNTETLNIEDKNLLIASGAADSSAADGAGITIDGADKSLEWEHGTSQFVFDAQVSSSVGFKGDGSNLTGVTAEEIEYTNILNKPTLVSGSDQILGGTNIVSSSTQVTNLLPDGTISGSSQVTYLDISSIPDGIVSGSTQIIESLPDGTISGSSQVIESLPDGTISGSSQVTYLDISSKPTGIVSGSSQIINILPDGVISGSSQLQSDYDIRYAPSSSLYTLIGNFPTSGSLGTAAFYNVSSSLADDPNVIPNVKAVYDYINNTIGAADITGVSASLGLSGGGDGGYVSMSLDTGSDHFINAVQGISPQLPSSLISGSGDMNQIPFFTDSLSTHITSSNSFKIIDGHTLEIGSLTETPNSRINLYESTEGNRLEIKIEGDKFEIHPPNDEGTYDNKLSHVNGGGWRIEGDNSSTSLNTGALIVSGGLGVHENLNVGGNISGSSFNGTGLLSGSITEQLPSGVVSGSSQTIDHIEVSTLVAINQTSPSSLGTNGEFIINGTTNSYSGILTLESGSVKVYNQYATESDKMINFLGGSGYGLFLQPDNTTSKAWVIDTDGDFVSQGTGDVYAENLYSTNAISGSSLSLAGGITLAGNISVSGTVDGIDIATDVAANTLKTGYSDSLVKTKLDAETVVSGSGQIDVTATSNYSNINQYTDSDNTTHLNSLGVLSGSTLEGDFTFDDNVIVEGNLTVNGTTTSVNSNTVNIGDNIIVLNSDEGGTPSQDAGVEIERGTATNARIMWDESEDYWSVGLAGAESKIITAGNVDYYTNTDNTTHLNSLSVISGSDQISALGYITSFTNTVDMGDGFKIASSDGTDQFTVTENEEIRFEGSGATSVSFDASTQKVTISSTDNNTTYTRSDFINQDVDTDSDVIFESVDIRDNGPLLILRDTNTTVNNNQVLGQIKFLHSDSNGGVAEVGVIKSVSTQAFTGVGNTGHKIHIDADTIVNGTLEATSDIVAYSSSDKRLKDEIIPISNPIDKINSIGGYSFVWNTEKQNIYKGKDYGVVAQEIEKILPELVETRENGYKAVKYDKLVSLLIEGIKELSTEVKELKEKINRE